MLKKIAAAFLFCALSVSAADHRLYELRTYYTLDGKLEARISHAQFLAHGEDSLFQIQSTYSLSDHLKVELALDLLSGERDSLMGQFADSDRIKMTIGYLLP